MKSGIINPIGDGFQGKYRYEERYEERWESGIPSVSQIPMTCHATAPKARLGVEIACFGLSR
jgi:hypothetical protein